MSLFDFARRSLGLLILFTLLFFDLTEVLQSATFSSLMNVDFESPFGRSPSVELSSELLAERSRAGADRLPHCTASRP